MNHRVCATNSSMIHYGVCQTQVRLPRAPNRAAHARGGARVPCFHRAHAVLSDARCKFQKRSMDPGHALLSLALFALFVAGHIGSQVSHGRLLRGETRLLSGQRGEAPRGEPDPTPQRHHALTATRHAVDDPWALACGQTRRGGKESLDSVTPCRTLHSWGCTMGTAARPLACT